MHGELATQFRQLSAECVQGLQVPTGVRLVVYDPQNVPDFLLRSCDHERVVVVVEAGTITTTATTSTNAAGDGGGCIVDECSVSISHLSCGDGGLLQLDEKDGLKEGEREEGGRKEVWEGGGGGGGGRI